MTSTPPALLQGLRESLPQSQQLSQALQNLVGKQPLLPATLQNAIRSLISQLPTRSEISGESLKAAFDRSGLFMENKLVRLAQNPQSASNLNQDLKAQLLELKQLFSSQSQQSSRPAPNQEQTDNLLKQLSNTTQGAIDTITVNQLKSLLPAESQPLFTDLTFQAPNQESETVKLIVREEQDGTGQDEESSWHFNLELDLSRLGRVTVQTTIQQEVTNIRFWVASEVVKNLFETQIERLQQALSKPQYNPLSIAIFVGQPTPPTDPIKNTNSALLDVSA